MSLHQPYDPDNIFAQIIADQMPAVKIIEDTDTMAFMDLFPQTDGHCLVISKTAMATNLLEIPRENLEKLIASVQRIAIAVEKAFKPDGIKVLQFNGSDAGQTVFHLHFHIIPTYAGQKARGHSSGKPAESKYLSQLAKKIAGQL